MCSGDMEPLPAERAALHGFLHQVRQVAEEALSDFENFPDISRHVTPAIGRYSACTAFELSRTLRLHFASENKKYVLKIAEMANRLKKLKVRVGLLHRLTQLRPSRSP